MSSAPASGQPSENFGRAASAPSPRRGSSRPLPGGGFVRSTTRAAGRGSRALLRVVRKTIGKKTRFKVKLAIALVVLASPVWGLNLLVAFLGHSVVFPLSPFFLRQKFAAVALYVRHRPLCFAGGHQDTDLLVKRVEARHHLPRGLLAAVIHVESRGFPHRISSAGAMGPGQLMPDTARELGVDDPFDTAQNAEGAGSLLARHVRRFHNLRFAVAAYNAGPGAVRGHIPDNGQTPAYVEKVMHMYAVLRPPPPPPTPRRRVIEPSSPAPRRPGRDHGPVRRGTALAFTGGE
ncbi:MAG: lytic transglycosylase domain-containing protein [Polyangia bacterium]